MLGVSRPADIFRCRHFATSLRAREQNNYNAQREQKGKQISLLGQGVCRLLSEHASCSLPGAEIVRKLRCSIFALAWQQATFIPSMKNLRPHAGPGSTRARPGNSVMLSGAAKRARALTCALSHREIEAHPLPLSFSVQPIGVHVQSRAQRLAVLPQCLGGHAGLACLFFGVHQTARAHLHGAPVSHTS